MNETSKVAGRSWVVSLAHAFAMLVACWVIYVAISVYVEGKAPAGVRGLVVLCAEATGYFFICLVPAWVVVLFRRPAAWIVWALAVGVFSFLMAKTPV